MKNSTNLSSNNAIVNELLLKRVNELLEFLLSNPPFLEVVSRFSNLFMDLERGIFLRNLDPASDNKANGYYERNLACSLGNLNLKVPRDRLGDFRPFILPSPYRRATDDMEDVMLKLVLSSYSPNKMKSFLNSLNLPYSKEEVEEIKEEILKEANGINTRGIKENYLAVYIDAYHTPIKEKVDEKIMEGVIYVIVGITLEGEKEMLGYYINIGNENKGDWLSILNHLIDRGLKRPLMIVSDDFPGLIEAIRVLFPNTDHQLCTIHLKRNIYRNISKAESKEFLVELKKIMLENNYDIALNKFDELCTKYEGKYPHFMKMLKEKKGHYFAYIKYPMDIRKYINNTNTVESVNSILETIRKTSGGHFQSIDTAKVSIYVIIKKLKNNKWSKGIPVIKSSRYEIMQMFNSRFQTQKS
jgi:transposase-like protein